MHDRPIRLLKQRFTPGVWCQEADLRNSQRAATRLLQRGGVGTEQKRLKLAQLDSNMACV